MCARESVCVHERVCVFNEYRVETESYREATHTMPYIALIVTSLSWHTDKYTVCLISMITFSLSVMC